MELRELLGAQDIAAPYVLVAHSLGGLYAHRFAQLYPRDVAGLVWLDALHRDWDAFMPPAAGPAAIERMPPGREKLEQMRPALRERRAELLADYPEHMREALIDAKESDEWTRSGIAASHRSGRTRHRTAGRSHPSRCPGSRRGGRRPRPAGADAGTDVAGDA